MNKILLIFILGMSLPYCQNGNSPLLDPPGGKSFWAVSIINDELKPYVVPALFVGASEHLEVYKEIYSKNPVSAAGIEKLISSFENNIIRVEHKIFGTPLDIDNNGKLTLLLLDVQDGYQGSEFIAGYFDPWNQFADVLVTKKTGFRSNEKEMLYIDTYPSVVGSDSSLSTAAHEYQHLLSFSHDIKSNVEKREEDWVNEGMSEMASDLTGFGPQKLRIDGFYKKNQTGYLEGNSLITWNNKLEDYSSSYLYFRYLADGFGCTDTSCDIISKIFSSTKAGVAGVNEAISIHMGSFSSTCGNLGALANSYFQCSYRYFWANILGYTNITGIAGATAFSFSRDSSYDIASQHKPVLPLISNAPQTLEYAPFRYGIFNKTSTPTLDGTCPGCNKSSFTLMYDSSSSNYIIYNHSEGVTGIVKRSPFPNIQTSTQQAINSAAYIATGPTVRKLHIKIPHSTFVSLKDESSY